MAHGVSQNGQALHPDINSVAARANSKLACRVIDFSPVCFADGSDPFP
jgi:hypothetical protein